MKKTKLTPRQSILAVAKQFNGEVSEPIDHTTFSEIILTVPVKFSINLWTYPHGRAFEIELNNDLVGRTNSEHLVEVLTALVAKASGVK